MLFFFASDTIVIQHDSMLFGDCGAMGTSRPTVGLRRDGEKSALPLKVSSLEIPLLTSSEEFGNMVGTDWGKRELELVMKQLGETVRSLAAARAAIDL